MSDIKTEILKGFDEERAFYGIAGRYIAEKAEELETRSEQIRVEVLEIVQHEQSKIRLNETAVFIGLAALGAFAGFVAGMRDTK